MEGNLPVPPRKKINVPRGTVDVIGESPTSPETFPAREEIAEEIFSDEEDGNESSLIRMFPLEEMFHVEHTYL
jgi:hypothetical protein